SCCCWREFRAARGSRPQERLSDDRELIGSSGRTFRLIETQGSGDERRISMTGDASVLGSLHSVDGEGVVRIEDRPDTGIDGLWGALTDPDRVARWYGEVEGELAQGGEFRLRIDLAGERTGRVEECEPPHRLLLTMRDPDPRPGQPEQTVI